MDETDLKTDRARSWVVAACCCFINFTFYGVSRLSGIMLVSVIHTFQVSRATAALPFSLSSAIRSLAGVFVGQIGYRFGVSTVVATGCLVASLGSGLCFFAQDVQWLTVCWGAVFGFGFGMSTCLLPLAINRNFVKHNGTASGISYSGSYLGSIMFSPLIMYLMDSYEFQGTFLVISGCLLNVLVAAALLREPKSNKKSAISGTSSASDPVPVSVIETGDLWKQNISRAFLASENNLREDISKPAFKCCNSDNNLYLSQEKKYPSVEVFEKCNNSFRNTQPHNLCNSFKCIKFESSFPSREFEKAFPEIIVPSSSLPKDNNSFQASKCSNSHFSKDINVVSAPKLISKGKYIAKYKMKLQKLKKVLEASLLGSKTPLKEFIQNGSVKLTSFKCGKRNSDGETDQSVWYVYNSAAVVLENSSTEEEPTFVSDMPGTKLTSSTGPKFRNSLKIYEKSFSFSRKIHDEGVPANHCDNSLQVNCMHLLSSTNKIHDDSYSKSFLYDNASRSCKTEDGLPYCLAGSPSKLYHEKSSTKKNHSSGSRSKSAAKSYFSDWLSMLREPMFTVIGVTMSIQTLTLLCVVTTIEDFAEDIGIQADMVHYALIALSASNLTGTLTLGTITDKGLISRPRFLSLCFLGMAVCLFSLSLLAVSLSSLLSLLAVYGLLESGVIITFPILTKEFMKGERRQAVAIASSNVLSAPTVMLMPMLIGHYRDHIGCYSGLFKLLGGISFISSIVWLVAPLVCRKLNSKKKGVLYVNGC